MGATEKLAQWAVDFDYSQLPPKGVENVKISILDTIGTALVGAKSPAGAIMTDFVKEMKGAPQARLIGSGIKTSVLDAAQANGVFAHYEDYDTVPHCGVVMMPTALTLGEHLKASGKQVLAAYAVAFEVGHRLRALGDVPAVGYHSTSIFYTMGAAAEAGKLYGLNLAQMRAAMGISASLTSGIQQNFGTYAKPLHAGNASRCGVMAAQLARRGFTGDPDVLEAKLGFFYVYGTQRADLRRVTENLGKTVAIAEGKLTVKEWPSCLANHPGMTAILPMILEYNLAPEDVAEIDVVQAAKYPGALIRHNPKNGFEGKFSLPFHLATALVDRKVDLNSFTDEKLARPMIQELMSKVKVSQDPERVGLPLRLRGGPLDEEAVTVTLKLKDGRVLSNHVPRGRALQGEAIYDKFRENAKIGGMAPAKIERTIELVKNLENVADITELVECYS